MSNGSSIPSGYAPVVLGDFASPTTAIGQLHTERLRKQAEADTTRQGKERAAMLKALDFSAVEGLSEQVSREHLDNVNDVTDKWARKWLEQGKKLTSNDYFDLERDKRGVEQNIAGKKHNVAQLAHAQNELRSRPYLYHPSSLERINEFVTEGNAGRDMTGILQPKFNMGRYLEETLKGVRAEMSDTETWNPDTKKYDVVSSNEPAVREKIQSLVATDPTIRQQLQDPYLGKEYADIIEAFTRSKVRSKETVKSPTTTDVHLVGKLTPAQQAIDAKYDWTGKGMERKHFQNMAELNDKIIPVLRKDRAALKALEGDYVKGVGTVKRAIVDNDGNVVLIGGSKKNRTTKMIDIPQDWNNEKEVKAAMIGATDAFRPDAMTSGKIPTNYTDFLPTDWETNIGEVAGNTYYEDLKAEAAKENPNTEAIISNLESLFEDEEIEKKEDSWLIWKEGVVFDGKKYKTKTPADMKDLVKAVEKKRGMTTVEEEDTATTIVSYILDGTTYAIPSEEEEEFLKDNPTAKKL